MEIPQQIRTAMVAHARFCLPAEACGLLASDAGARLRMAYCLTNQAVDPSSYTVDPTEHMRALQHAERNGWVISGVFHSHPDGPAEPSQRDIAGALDPAWLYVIVGHPLRAAPEIRAFRIAATTVAEVPVAGQASGRRVAPSS